MQDQTSIATDLLLAVLTMLGQQPLDAPRTLSIEPRELQERVCGGECRVYAWYAPEGTIYFDERLDPRRSVFARGVLVHELVHHIQRMRTGHLARDCTEWRNRERAAYAIQSHWLQQHGVVSPDLMLQSRIVRCFLASGNSRNYSRP